MSNAVEKKSNAVARNYIDEFRKAWQNGIDGLSQAAQVYVDAIDADSDISKQLQDEFSDLPQGVWGQLEQLGRKMIHPKLLMGCGGRHATKIKKMPYSVQNRIFAGDTFPLLTKDNDTLMIDVRNATDEQVEQLFDRDHIRTLTEQKVLRVSETSNSTKSNGGADIAEPERLPYIIKENRVIFRRDVTLTKQDVRNILAQM